MTASRIIVFTAAAILFLNAGVQNVPSQNLSEWNIYFDKKPTYAIRFRCTIGDRREIGGEGDFHFTRGLFINCRQDSSRCRRRGGFL